MGAEIGDKKVVSVFSLIAPDDVPSSVETVIDSQAIKLKLHFHPNDGDQPRIDWQPEGEYLNIYFRGWKNSLGTATEKPVKIATDPSGKILGFMVAHWRIGNVNRIDFQLLLGGNYEQ